MPSGRRQAGTRWVAVVELVTEGIERHGQDDRHANPVAAHPPPACRTLRSGVPPETRGILDATPHVFDLE